MLYKSINGKQQLIYKKGSTCIFVKKYNQTLVEPAKSGGLHLAEER